MNVIRHSQGPNLLPHVFAKCVFEGVARLARTERHKHSHGLPLHVVRPTNRRCLRYRRMADQRAFNLDRREPVTGHVEHIVNAAHDPVIAISVLSGVVACQILPGHTRPVGFTKSLVVAPDASQHSRPRLRQYQPASFALVHRVACGIHDLRTNSRQWQRATARLGGRATRQWAHHDAARFRLPPRIHNRAAFAADHLVIPDPRFGIDAFANGAKQAQAGEITALDVLHAPLHKRPDRRGGGIKNRWLFLFDDLPESALVRRVWRSFIDQNARASGQWTIRHIGVAGDPTAVGGAPEKIVLAQVKHPLGGGLSPHEIAGGRVLDALWFSSRAAGIQNKEWGLGIHCHRRSVGGHPSHQIVPPHITARHHLHWLARTLEHNDMLHGLGPVDRTLVESLVDVFLER